MIALSFSNLIFKFPISLIRLFLLCRYKHRHLDARTIELRVYFAITLVLIFDVFQRDCERRVISFDRDLYKRGNEPRDDMDEVLFHNRLAYQLFQERMHARGRLFDHRQKPHLRMLFQNLRGFFPHRSVPELLRGAFNHRFFIRFYSSLRPCSFY